MSIYQVGQRISVDQSHASIRFVGALQNRAGEWIGLEWDADGRGKNNGSLDGVTYFTCAESKGSFIRIDVGNPPIHQGFSFIRAFLERYKPSMVNETKTSSEGNVEGQDDDEDLYVMSVRNRKMAVDFVGKDKVERKQGQLENLDKASLVSCMVSRIDDGESISKTIPNLVELDLSKNLLSTWEDISHLGEQLPKLEWLKLSENILQRVPVSITGLENAFRKLRILILNKTGTTWNDVMKIEPFMPDIEELHVCDNFISDVTIERNSSGESARTIFPRLKVLDLENNSITSWDAVWTLSYIPVLEKLLLSNNSISSLCYRREGGVSARIPFAQLQSLSLEKNPIASWELLDELSLFPLLSELRFQQTSLTEQAGPSSSRIIIVGRLQKINKLNGGMVRAKERADCEKLFVRRYLLEHPELIKKLQSEGRPDNSLLMSRLWDLVRTHPDSVPTDHDAAQSAASKQPASSNFINITLRSVAAGSATKDPVSKKIPLSITIDKLKILFYRLFGLDVSRQKLYFVPEDMPVPQALSDDFRDLDYYGVTEGCVIIMEES